AVLRREEPLDRTTNPCIDLLLRTINVIRQNAPDDIHMSQRYADLLEIFVNAVLRPSAMANNTTPGGNQIEVIGSRLSPNRAESELVESSPLKLGYDWIYDSNFWDTLPEMVIMNKAPKTPESKWAIRLDDDCPLGRHFLQWRTSLRLCFLRAVSTARSDMCTGVKGV
ncbi:hypothetical protein KXV50_005037, partial [Aspergillus fumigatus]